MFRVRLCVSLFIYVHKCLYFAPEWVCMFLYVYVCVLCFNVSFTCVHVCVSLCVQLCLSGCFWMRFSWLFVCIDCTPSCPLNCTPSCPLKRSNVIKLDYKEVDVKHTFMFLISCPVDRYCSAPGDTSDFFLLLTPLRGKLNLPLFLTYVGVVDIIFSNILVFLDYNNCVW